MEQTYKTIVMEIRAEAMKKAREIHSALTACKAKVNLAFASRNVSSHCYGSSEWGDLNDQMEREFSAMSADSITHAVQMFEDICVNLIDLEKDICRVYVVYETVNDEEFAVNDSLHNWVHEQWLYLQEEELTLLAEKRDAIEKMLNEYGKTNKH